MLWQGPALRTAPTVSSEQRHWGCRSPGWKLWEYGASPPGLSRTLRGYCSTQAGLAAAPSSLQERRLLLPPNPPGFNLQPVRPQGGWGCSQQGLQPSLGCPQHSWAGRADPVPSRLTPSGPISARCLGFPQGRGVGSAPVALCPPQHSTQQCGMGGSSGQAAEIEILYMLCCSMDAHTAQLGPAGSVPAPPSLSTLWLLGSARLQVSLWG